jgi:microcin C transport system permease protein
MKTYLLRRLLLVLPTLFGISLVTFVLVNVLPGGPIEQRMIALKFGGSGGGEMGAGGDQNSSLDEEYLKALNEYYGFDKPLPLRYLTWMGHVLQGDLGESYFYEEPVLGVIAERLPVSIIFGLVSLFVIYGICIPLGILKAVRHRTTFDNLTSSMIFLGYSVPGWALLILLLVIFGGGSFFDWFPIQGLTSDNFDDLSFFGKVGDVIHHMTLPIIGYSVSLFAFNTMLMKNSLIEQLSTDYVRTAFAKGLPARKVILGHALRNALIPIATGLGSFMTFFMVGSILIESIAGLNGMGKLALDSLLNRDYPVSLGLILIGSLMTIIGQILADISYVLVDPRIDFS